MSMFDVSTIFPKNIIVFGAGGGGARLVSELPSFLFEASGAGRFDLRISNMPKIHLVDYDKVEPKNCFRQPFFPWDVGELKVASLKSRFQGLLNIEAIPEASNVETLPKIFNQETLSQNFIVISQLDHAVSTSQIYTWLLANAPDTVSWFWFYGGMNLIEQQIEGVFRKVDQKVKVPYVTAYMSGKIKGQPIIPDLNDERFKNAFPRPIPTHVAHADVIVDTTGIRGRESDGGGCGLSDSDRVEQAGLGNLSATLMTLKQLRSLFLDGVIIPEMIEENYSMQPILPYTLDEIFFPDEYPELLNLLTKEETTDDNQIDPGTDSSQSEAEQDGGEGVAADSPADSTEFVWEPDNQASQAEN